MEGFLDTDSQKVDLFNWHLCNGYHTTNAAQSARLPIKGCSYSKSPILPPIGRVCTRHIAYSRHHECRLPCSVAPCIAVLSSTCSHPIYRPLPPKPVQLFARSVAPSARLKLYRPVVKFIAWIERVLLRKSAYGVLFNIERGMSYLFMF